MGCGSAKYATTDEFKQSKNIQNNIKQNDTVNQQLINLTEETSARFLTDPDELDKIMRGSNNKEKNELVDKSGLNMDVDMVVKQIQKAIPIQSVILFKQIQNNNQNLTYNALYEHIQSQELLVNQISVTSLLNMTKQELSTNMSKQQMPLDRFESFACIKVITQMNFHLYTQNILMKESYDKLQYSVMNMQNKLYNNQGILQQLKEKHTTMVNQFKKIHENYLKLNEKYVNCKQCVTFLNDDSQDKQIAFNILKQFLHIDKRQRYKISLNDCKRRSTYYKIFSQFTEDESEYLSILQFSKMYKWQQQHQKDDKLENPDEQQNITLHDKYSIQQVIQEITLMNPQLTNSQIEEQFRKLESEGCGYITSSQYNTLKSQLIEMSFSQSPIRKDEYQRTRLTRSKRVKEKVDFNHVLSILLENHPDVDLDVADLVFKQSKLVKDEQIEKKNIEQLIQEIQNYNYKQHVEQQVQSNQESQIEPKEIDDNPYQNPISYEAINQIISQQQNNSKSPEKESRTLLDDVLEDLEPQNYVLAIPDNNISQDQMRNSIDDLQFSQSQPIEASDREQRRSIASSGVHNLRKVDELEESLE